MSFDIQGRLGLGVAYMAIFVKDSGSSLVKLFYPSFFFILNKNRHEEHKGHAMIFMCDKKCQTVIFEKRRWHQTTTALSIPKANTWSILYQSSV